MATTVVCNDSNPDNPSTANSTITANQKHSTPGFNSNCYRRRLIKRLKEKFLIPDPSDDQSNPRPTVIRIGTVSSCASSTVRSRASNGNGGSLRLVDELFRRGHVSGAQSTISSTRSNKTILYDDRWSDPNFCTVVAVVDGTEIMDTGLSNIVTVDESDQNQDPCTSNSNTATGGTSAKATASLDPNPDYDQDNPGFMGQYPHPQIGFPQPLSAGMPTDFQQQPWTVLNVDPGCGQNGNEIPFEIRANLGSTGLGQQHNILAPDELPRMFPANTWNLMGAPTRFEEQLEENAKGCCGSGRESQSAFVRWFIGIISVIGFSCVIVGIVLGALTVSGSTRLTLCLLMIGVGIVLVTVSGIAWRLITFDSPDACTNCILSNCCLTTCGWRTGRRRRRRAMISIPGQMSSTVAYSRVRSFHRNPNRYHQSPPNNCIPPEFIWRPPPPSYHASIQDERIQRIFNPQRANDDLQTAIGSPPPTYRSRIGENNNRQSISDLVQICSNRQGTQTTMDNAESEAPIQIGPASADCALSQEPIQQDESASLVLNEQLQSASQSEMAAPPLEMRPQFSGHPRSRRQMQIHWPPPMPPFGLCHLAPQFRNPTPITVMRSSDPRFMAPFCHFHTRTIAPNQRNGVERR